MKKLNCIYKLKQGYERYKICFDYLNRGFVFIEKVFNQLLKSKYISTENKLIILNMKKEIFEKRFFNK